MSISWPDGLSVLERDGLFELTIKDGPKRQIARLALEGAVALHAELARFIESGKARTAVPPVGRSEHLTRCGFTEAPPVRAPFMGDGRVP